MYKVVERCGSRRSGQCKLAVGTLVDWPARMGSTVYLGELADVMLRLAPRTPLDPGQIFNHGEPALTLSIPPLKFAELALACAQSPVNFLARG